MRTAAMGKGERVSRLPEAKDRKGNGQRLALRPALLAFGCVVWAILTAGAAGEAAALPHMVFERYVDKTEGAFLVLVPQGWTTRGGMVRVDPLAAGGAGQSIEAKIDFAMLREPEGKVAIRWLPKIAYAQPSPYNAMLGGNWNGMPIVPMPSPEQYLTGTVLATLHPQARNVRVVEQTKRPDVCAAIRAMPAARAVMSQGAEYYVDAAIVTVAYEEAGTSYREALFTAIEGFAMAGTGLWSNPFTMAARAPEAEYERYQPVATVVINSFALNPRWLAAEMQGQIQRSEIASATLRDLARIDAEIAQNRREAMAQIQDDQYLTLTSQERYLNPHTGEEELGSNQWKHRWVDASGRVIYTDDDSWDPNHDPDLHVSGFERSGLKPRK